MGGNDTQIILGAMQASEARIRDDIKELRNKQEAQAITQGQHALKLEGLEQDTDRLWKRVRAISAGHKTDGSPKFWWTVVEFLMTIPTATHALWVTGGAVVAVAVFLLKHWPK